MSLRHGARLAALIAPLALLLPTAVQAETVTVDDAVADAKALNLASELGFFFGTPDEGQPLFLDAPAETSTDIVRTTITHAKRVTITTYFRDLGEIAGEHSLDMRLRTSEGRADLSVFRAADGSSVAILSPAVAVSADGEVSPRPCRTVRGRYDVTADTVTTSFPAACLDNPKWLQLSSGASRLKVTPIGDGSINLAGWADDAFRSGLSENSMGRSPKVRRG